MSRQKTVVVCIVLTALSDAAVRFSPRLSPSFGVDSVGIIVDLGILPDRQFSG